MTITVRTAEMSDAVPVGARLCDADAIPLLSQGLDLQEVVERSMAASDQCWAIAVNNEDRLDEAVAVFGVSSTEGVAQAWLLATDELFTVHSTFFLRITRPILDGFKDLYSSVVVYADPLNSNLTRWLKWSGFTTAGEITEATGRTLIQWRLN